MRGWSILVTRAGEAEGSPALAAALACAGSDQHRAAVLVELSEGRAPRPGLVASAAARALEERLAGHLPEATVASRGSFCHLALPAGGEGLERAPAALALVRDSLGVVLLPPDLLQAALQPGGLEPGAALLRADLARDRALAALAVRDLIGRGLPVAVAKKPLDWVSARRALFGALPRGSAGGLSPRLLRRLGAGERPGAAV
jgi:hypothetical protein